MHVVWFKRDLRLRDHAPLYQATQLGRCLCLYVYEPELLHSDEFDTSHLQFINESLADLDAQLQEVGGHLTYRVGNMPDVLTNLHHAHPIQSLWSHEETGNKITYDRDRRVSRWARTHQVPWTEIPQNGVVRRLASRDGWSGQRTRFMKQPQSPTPVAITPTDVPPETRRTPADVKLPPTDKTQLQPGGETQASDCLAAFLSERGERYNKEMSSPVSAWNSCSRLSAYLAWGCISTKTVTHALWRRQTDLRARKKAGRDTGGWLAALKAYESRLSWHCHFMQKLEDEPDLEFQNMSSAYDGLRENDFNQEYFQAWCDGQTGYPLVDACMRALHRHSWINFRMRAMLVSFASYHLWLHWRPTAVFLGQHFLDFEPGIHFSQFQMQSGTTGINAIRIYSPIKQVHDQDPEGVFIRKFIPELATVPKEFIAEPHKMPLSMQSLVGCRIGHDYPAPIVEHATAYRAARERIYSVRGNQNARSDAQRVMKKHGSRKGLMKKRGR